MIIPNLMVTDMRQSLAFYRDTLGLRVSVAVSPQRDVLAENNADQAVFVTLEWQAAQLMLQTVTSLAEELPIFAADQLPKPAGTVYFRGLSPDAVLERVSEEHIIKGPFLQWYGMKELYLRDPDGHVICLGVPEGTPPE